MCENDEHIMQTCEQLVVVTRNRHEVSTSSTTDTTESDDDCVDDELKFLDKNRKSQTNNTTLDQIAEVDKFIEALTSQTMTTDDNSSMENHNIEREFTKKGRK